MSAFQFLALHISSPFFTLFISSFLLLLSSPFLRDKLKQVINYPFCSFSYSFLLLPPFFSSADYLFSSSITSLPLYIILSSFLPCSIHLFLLPFLPSFLPACLPSIFPPPPFCQPTETQYSLTRSLWTNEDLVSAP